jgi:hypothetical protein
MLILNNLIAQICTRIVKNTCFANVAGRNIIAGKNHPFFCARQGRVVDRLEPDRYVERRNAMARTESAVPEKEEIIVSLKK